MKKETHPQYYPASKVTCACGATYEVGSTVKELEVEICQACHPFFTGKDKVLDTAGRVEKFKRRLAHKTTTKTAKTTAKKK